MPRLNSETPEYLKPFIFHGLDPRSKSSKEAVAVCPVCDKPKFGVNVETGQWDCKSCQAKGNVPEFLRWIWERSVQATKPGDYAALAKERGLLSPDTPRAWGLARSIITGLWLIPAYGTDGKLNQLYVRKRLKDKWANLATPTCSHHLHGVPLWKKEKGEVYVCEGAFDGMALWETLKRVKTVGGKIVETSNESQSLLGSVNVIAVPGAGAFNERWADLVRGKVVTFLYDSDRPKPTKAGVIAPPAGITGVRRALCELVMREKRPGTLKVRYLAWGPDGFSPEKNDGWDVRDELRQGATAAERGRIWADLTKRIEPIPGDWFEEAKEQNSDQLKALKCESYAELVKQWKAAYLFSTSWDTVLSVMLASIVSTPRQGDQLWIKVIGPPSSGKSTLCEALSVSKKYVVAKSTIKGFHSGFKTDGDGEEDHSLLKAIDGKTLIVKDGDTVMQQPNVTQILSEARDVYDGASRTHYRNAIARDYIGFRATWILCGTEALRVMDENSLGERFLTVRLEVSHKRKREIYLAAADDADEELNHEMGRRGEEQNTPEKTRTMQLTGGYVEWLREKGQEAFRSVSFPRAHKERIAALGEFVSSMRAREGATTAERPEREFAARLIKQLTRLAKCLAVVTNKNSVDEDVMRRVDQVAIDTAAGMSTDVAKHLYDHVEAGCTVEGLSAFTGIGHNELRRHLNFLCRVGVVDVCKGKARGTHGSGRYVLSPEMQELYGEVMGE